ncbi:MAG: pilus assembly protein [Paracoccaceae bacterium]|nr:pilus assembly protein [Paracoccaceae bacterium]
MTRYLNPYLKRFAANEGGSMVVPFALWLPIFLVLILSSIELGTLTIRQTALERALDDTVRDVRIGGVTSAEEIKQTVCTKAAVLPSCETMLRLEMVQLDMHNWTAPPAAADCVDVSQDVRPYQSFSPMGGGRIMLLRACYKYQPITPAGTISSSLAKDAEGYTAIVTTSAFVTEPS